MLSGYLPRMRDKASAQMLASLCPGRDLMKVQKQ
jgi:hypothetical protein